MHILSWPCRGPLLLNPGVRPTPCYALVRVLCYGPSQSTRLREAVRRPLRQPTELALRRMALAHNEAAQGRIRMWNLRPRHTVGHHPLSPVCVSC